jgi:hypothetical protein
MVYLDALFTSNPFEALARRSRAGIRIHKPSVARCYDNFGQRGLMRNPVASLCVHRLAGARCFPGGHRTRPVRLVRPSPVRNYGPQRDDQPSR